MKWFWQSRPKPKEEWKHSNLPGQEARFRSIEERLDKMKLNFDAANAALAELRAAVVTANALIATLVERINELSKDNGDQAVLDQLAADVSAEANKLPRDAGASAGGITG